MNIQGKATLHYSSFFYLFLFIFFFPACISCLTEQSRLLEDDDSLVNRIITRNPYLDPLNHIQITCLQRRRDPDLSEEEKSFWLDPLLRTIKAIAANMRNTG